MFSVTFPVSLPLLRKDERTVIVIKMDMVIGKRQREMKNMDKKLLEHFCPSQT